MSAKTVELKYLIVSILACVLCIVLSFNAAGWAPLILLIFFGSVFVVVFSSGGIFLTPFRIHSVLILLVACILIFQTIMIRRSLQPDLGLEEDLISCVEGTVIYDSSFTQSGNHYMKISLRKCSTESGDSCTAEGVLVVVGRESEIISSGIALKLTGRFSEGIFVYDDLQVTGRNAFNTFRERLVGFLQRRMLPDSDDYPSLLSCQLFLGRADEGTLPLVQKARDCGCAHVLALSGMHLGILLSVCTAVFGKGKPGRVVGLFAVAAFVTVAGPRPSLVRAALGCFLFFVGVKERLFLVLFLQMLFFPQSFAELGCCYGYVAIFAIISLSPYIEAVLFQYIGQFARLPAATLAALLFSVPVQMLANGYWCPSAIISSPLAGLFAAFSMVIGLLELSFGHLPILVKLNALVYSLMERLFDTFGHWPRSGWVGYIFFVALIALMLSANRLDHWMIAGHLKPNRPLHFY